MHYYHTTATLLPACILVNLTTTAIPLGFALTWHSNVCYSEKCSICHILQLTQGYKAVTWQLYHTYNYIPIKP